MTLLKVKQIHWEIKVSIGCSKCGTLEKYIITVLENTTSPDMKGITFLLCDDCYQSLLAFTNAKEMSVN